MRLWRFVFASIVPAALVAGGAVPAPRAAQDDPRERALYVSVLDEQGRPVPDLGPEAFIVREDGVRREVLRVERATQPMDIAVLIDDSQAASPAMLDIRKAATAFVEALAGPHRLALIGFGERPTILSDYTADAARLTDAAGRLFARSGSGAYLLDALIETSDGLVRRDPVRPVIVAVSTEGREFSERDHALVIDQVRRAGAAFHALILTQSGGGASTADWARERNLVLDRGTRETGGRRDDLLTSMALTGRMEALAAELANQYRIVYFRPETLIPPERVDVVSSQPGWTARGTPERRRAM